MQFFLVQWLISKKKRHIGHKIFQTLKTPLYLDGGVPAVLATPPPPVAVRVHCVPDAESVGGGVDPSTHGSQAQQVGAGPVVCISADRKRGKIHDGEAIPHLLWRQLS